MEKRKGTVSTGSRVAYGIGDFAGNLLSGATSSFIAMYYTDSVLVSALFVGTMMVVARILDAISDLVMGYIIDHTNFKLGKARPWFLIGIIPLLVSCFLMFHVPSGLSGNGKEIYIVVTYVLNTVICMTIFNVSYSTLCTYMSDDILTRIKMNGTRTFFATLAMMVANMFTTNILASFGFQQKAYDIMVLIYCAISLVCLLITGFACKENHVPNSTNKPSAKASLAAIFSNRYVSLITLAFVFNWFLLGSNGSSMVYFVRDCLGSMELMGPVSAASFLPALVILALGIVPRVAKKIGKRTTLMIGGGIEALGLFIVAVAPVSLPIVAIGMVLKACGMATVNALLFATVSDVAIYTSKTQKGEFAGITNSVTSFGMKVGIGFGSAVITWLLAWANYDGAASVQNAPALLAEKIGFSAVPCGCAIVVFILMSFVDVEKKLKEMQ